MTIVCDHFTVKPANGKLELTIFRKEEPDTIVEKQMSKADVIAMFNLKGPRTLNRWMYVIRDPIPFSGGKGTSRHPKFDRNALRRWAHKNSIEMCEATA